MTFKKGNNFWKNRKNEGMLGKKHSEETKKKIKKKAKKRFKDGQVIWSKGLTKKNHPSLKRTSKLMQGNKNWDNPNSKKNQFKKGDTSWAKGKTKENCEILKKGGEKISKTKKRLSKEGKLKSWCKGKTKKNNKSLKAISEKMKNGGALKARMANKGNPSKPELELKKLIKNHKIKLSHNSVKKGIWFRGKTQSFNPDFINKKEKKIVELFGRYWHNLPEKKKADKERLETYKKYGYSTLIIWDFEMKNKDNVLIKLRGFL